MVNEVTQFYEWMESMWISRKSGIIFFKILGLFDSQKLVNFYMKLIGCPEKGSDANF